MTPPPDIGAALLAELTSREAPVAPRETSPASLPKAGTAQSASQQLPVAQATYSHEAMVALMVEHPQWTDRQFAAYFGHLPAWFSAVLASSQFQQVLDTRRHEICNPALTASMEDRFRALALQSVGVLQQKLNTNGVSDLVVLKSAELGIKALGLGALPPPDPNPTQETGAAAVADKIMKAMAKAREAAVNGAAVDVEAREVPDDND